MDQEGKWLGFLGVQESVGSNPAVPTFKIITLRAPIRRPFSLCSTLSSTFASIFLLIFLQEYFGVKSASEPGIFFDKAS